MKNVIVDVLALARMFVVMVVIGAGEVVVGAPQPAPAAGGSSAPKVPALFAFGDSIVDTGNNNYIRTFTRSNFRPYGREWPGHEPTGRFSSGKISMDFLASSLAVKEVLPPYLDKNLTLADLKTGVSFASAGSGYDNATCTVSLAMTVEQQLELFKEYKARVGSIPYRSLYLVCWGSNDVLQYFTFFYSDGGVTEAAYTDFMAQRASSFIQNLIDLGARQIAMTGVPPVGCVPAQRLIAGGLGRRCATDRNRLAQLYNRKLSREVARLAGRFPKVNLVYIDLYSILDDIVRRYQQLGFKNGNDSCCGLFGIESGPLCNLASSVCEDPSHYVFWDAYHPSQRAYKIMIDQLIARYMRFLR